MGVFGTHQHDLFEERLGLLPKLPRSFCCHMHVAPGPLPEDSSLRGLPWLRRTFRLAPGVSTDSLAFQVAYEEVCKRRPEHPRTASGGYSEPHSHSCVGKVYVCGYLSHLALM